MRPRLLIAEPDRFSARALVSLQEWADVEALSVTATQFQSAFKKYDIIWLRLGFRVTPRELQPPIRCRILAIPVTGLDHLDTAACERGRVAVVSLHGENEFLKEVRATAELTIALVLALIRKIPFAQQSVLSGVWQRDLFPGTELYGKTVALIGMGRLGKIVATYFKAFGMRVLGCDPFTAFPSELAEPRPTIEDAVKAADFVSVHVSYNVSTHNLLNRSVFARMKPGAILLNTSRGGVVDEVALLAALQSGHLAGAALDVVDGEPSVGASNPLVAYARTHDNLLITPHIGGNTRESVEKTELFLAEKVHQTWRGLLNSHE